MVKSKGKLMESPDLAERASKLRQGWAGMMRLGVRSGHFGCTERTRVGGLVSGSCGQG